MPETLDSLQLELAELRGSRKRLVLAAAAERRGIERELHDGVQQDLVALAVNLQLAAQAAGSDPAAAKELLEAMGRDVQQALDGAAQLAERIYPALREAGSLAAALRSAAARASVPVYVEVAPSASYAPDVAAAVCLCCRDALELAGPGARATIAVRDEDGAMGFEIVLDGADANALDQLRERVDALGGRLTVRG
jgi:signal transduction histidine kinase